MAFSEPKEFESALVTWGAWKRRSNNELQITDGEAEVKVGIDTGGRPFNLRWEELDEDVPSGRKSKRLGVVLTSPISSASVTLTVQPVP